MKAFVMIGNSDDKLGQRDWKRFIQDVRGEIHSFGQELHGEWFSAPDSAFQNACWCVEVHDQVAQDFKDRLRWLATTHGQDSIAFDEVAETVLLVPGR